MRMAVLLSANTFRTTRENCCSNNVATSVVVMAVAYPCPRASDVVKMFPRTAIRCAGTRACVPPAAMIRAPAYAPKYRPCGKRSAENPVSGCCAYKFFKAGKSETVSCLTGRRGTDVRHRQEIEGMVMLTIIFHVVSG